MTSKTDIDPGIDTLDGADVCDKAPEPEDEEECTQRPAALKLKRKRAPTKKVKALLASADQTTARTSA